MKKKNVYVTLVAACSLFLAACGSSTTADEATKVSVGVVSEVEVDVWKDVKKRLEDKNIDLTIETFSDYPQVNLALADGSLDLNAFQHVAYLEDFNTSNDGEITPIGFTYVSPLGLYSDRIEDYNELSDGAEIALPNDVTNGGRGLLLLQALDLITLDESKGTNPTVNDITENPKNLKFVELDAAQIARSLQDVDAAIINTNYATDSGLNPKEDALYLDTDSISDVSEIYKNVIAARVEDKDNDIYKTVVEEYQTQETADLLDEISKGNDVPAWE
ncbi:MetQ/NlpA family ABC transporter substrate-binding protein [Jeotgalibaca sp. MA1X17-3]|uniref:MetQ/NlpA family ABC transporter substrate-binding protein n=1 Tax=Jeotgalibaca sp. MA1X17-3 TaxID=2908211 RepID=UPI001F48E3E1|nr:MetQ/NlpA family ABC transporter substrate-binding protein [Jeotgalibaca sp. MA1X17-3]UJF15904.1 MetQ/NlpA family ABC transporter substrate-binding protein [Jeotgalibaca sp. MA1X17-3]